MKKKTKQRTGSLTTIGQAFVIIFCLWHMFAVATFAIPREASDSFSTSARTLFFPIITPYIHATSQWQLWNLFAPDPLRRVTERRIDTQREDGWHALRTFDGTSVPFWERATTYKLFSNILETDSHSKDGTKIRLMQKLGCEDFHLVSGTHVRIVEKWYDLPFLKYPVSGSTWSAWRPTNRVSAMEISCPPVSKKI